MSSVKTLPRWDMTPIFPGMDSPEFADGFSTQLGIRLTAWIGSLNVEVLIEHSPIAREHAFMLRKAKISAEHLMTPPGRNCMELSHLS